MKYAVCKLYGKDNPMWFIEGRYSSIRRALQAYKDLKKRDSLPTRVFHLYDFPSTDRWF